MDYPVMILSQETIDKMPQLSYGEAIKTAEGEVEQTGSDRYIYLVWKKLSLKREVTIEDIHINGKKEAEQ